MIPTLIPGDQIFVVKLATGEPWKHGDLLVFASDSPSLTPGRPKPTYIKRIIALGGETVEWSGQNMLINGKVNHQQVCKRATYSYMDSKFEGDQPTTVTPACVAETNLAGKTYDVLYDTDLDASPRLNHGQVTLGRDQIFVVGDNRDRSMDSRFTGPVDRASVIGRAELVWFSYSSAEGVRWNRLGQRL